MAKRFTDTSKWDKAWFRKLPPKMKCAWLFLCDRCDHAGIWNIDEEILTHFIGEQLSLAEVVECLAHRVRLLDDEKLLISGFIDFQYGTLNPANRVHKSVITMLEKEGAYKGLIRPLEGAKDKDKDKDKEKDKDKDKEKDPLKFDFEEIYNAYPRKEGKAKAMSVLNKTIQTPEDFDSLAKAVKNYAEDCKRENRERQYIRQFVTFIGPIHQPYWRDWINWKPDTAKGNKLAGMQRDINHDDELNEAYRKSGLLEFIK